MSEPLSHDAAVLALLATDEPPPAEEQPDPETQEDIPDEEEATDDPEVEDISESEDEAEEPEAPEEPQLYTVKVDGQERRVTLEELTRDYSGQASIQRRIQEAENLRKEAEAKAQQADALAATFQSEYQRLQTVLESVQTQGLRPRPTPPDPRLLDANPTAYHKARAQYDVDLEAFQRQQASLQETHQRNAWLEQARRIQAQRAQESFVAEQTRVLAERVPDFAKPETAKAAAERLLKAAEHYGYTPEEVGAVMDARAVQVLHDAARYRELQQRKTEARKAPTQTPRHVPPPAAKRAEPPQLAQARQLQQRLRKGPLSRDEAVDLLLVPQTRK